MCTADVHVYEKQQSANSTLEPTQYGAMVMQPMGGDGTDVGDTAM